MADGEAKPKKLFLRRGEGIDRRMNAYKLRGQVQPKASSRSGSGPAPPPASQRRGSSLSPARRPLTARSPTWENRGPSQESTAQNGSRAQNSPNRGGGGRVANSPPRSNGQMVQASPPRGGGRVQNSPPPMASPSPWARGSSPWRGWVRNSAFQNTGGQDPDKIDWGRNHPKPHPSHPSDFSIELSSDSTLVNIQKQAAADALDAEATLNPNSNGIRSNSNQNAWGRELSHVSEDEEVYGFDENHAVEEEKAESCRAHESEVLGGQAEAAGDGGWQFPTLASRRLQPWEREAEEELELAEFEALERRVRRELGEMSVDHGKPPAEDPKNTAKQASVWSRYGSQPVGAVQHNNPPPGGAWSHAVAAVAAQEDPPPVPGRKHGWGPEGAAQPDPYFDDDETWEDEEQEAGEAYQRSQPGQGDSPRLQGATQGEPDLQPRRGGNNCPGDAPQSSALMQSLFHKSKMEEDAKEARARAAAAHREAEKIQVLEEEIKKFQADRNEISRMKNELQVAATSLENEKIAFERQKAAELASLLEEKENAARQHKREKSVLEKQRKALLKMPTKKERAEIEALEEALEKERKDGRAREARHKLTVERLRRQMVELQQRNAELREEVQWHERQRLSQTSPAEPQVREPTAAAHKTPSAKENASPNLKVGKTHTGTGYGTKTERHQESSGGDAELGDPIEEDDKLSLAGSAYEHRQATIHELSDTQGSGWQDSYSYAYDDAEMNGAADEEMVYYDHHSDMYRARSAGGGARPSWADASGKSPDAHGDRQRSVRATTRVWTNDRTVESNGSADPNLAPRGRGASALEAAEPWGDRLQQKQSVDLKAFEPISFQTTVAGPSMKLPSCSGSSAAGTEVRRYEQRDESASDIRDSQSAWRPESAHGAGNDWAVGGRSGARGSHEQEQASVSQAGLEHRRQASVGYQRLNLNVTRNPEYARSSADPGQQPTETSFAPPGRSAATLSVSLATPVAMAPATVPMDIYSRPFHSGSSASVNGQQHPPPKEGVAFTGGADLVTHKVQHADGKLEQMFASGKRSVLFANGTYKEQLPDGTTIICFKNQDIKRSAPSGKVEYYYAEVDTWHTTHPSGVEVFYFPNGQTEAHQPNGIKQIRFPDGMIRQVQPTGSEEEIHPSRLLSVLHEPAPVLPPQSAQAHK